MRMLGIAITVASVVLLSGCVPTDPVVTPVPEASSTPVFASEDDALAAAEAAYAAYVAVADEVFKDSGSNPERLQEVASRDQLEQDTDAFTEVARLGYHSTGGTTFDQVQLQQLSQDPHALEDVVSVYLCEDVSEVDVLDSAGKSVVSTSRPDKAMYEVSFDRANTSSLKLLVASKQPWDSSCE